MDAEPNKEAADTIARLRSRSAPIIERAPLPIVEVQGKAHIVSYVNSAFCTWLGKRREELIGKPFAEIVCGGDECVPIFDQVYETGKGAIHAREDETDPQSAYWLYAMWPALDENDRPAGVIIQLTKAAKLRQTAAEMNEALMISAMRQHELTERAEKLNERLQQANEQIDQHAANLEKEVVRRTDQLSDSVKSLESLTYTMAHDLRAPIRAMRAFTLALWEDVPLNEEGKNYAEKINKAAERMDQLVNDLLDYGQLTHLDFPIHRVDLKTSVETVLAHLAAQIEETHAEVQVQEPLPAILGNKTLVEQSVSNLISNALKFLAPGVKPKIRIHAETRGSMERLWVEDNGIGIAARHQDKIFGVFQRLHTNEEFRGTGVGLAIVKRAVERMGGTIGLESEPGKGSRFWIEVPKA